MGHTLLVYLSYLLRSFRTLGLARRTSGVGSSLVEGAIRPFISNQGSVYSNASKRQGKSFVTVGNSVARVV